MRHKLVCWLDYAIPVPLKANWIARDQKGIWFWHEIKPVKTVGIMTGKGVWVSHGKCARMSYIDIDPPEPGRWHEQIYWIGD